MDTHHASLHVPVKNNLESREYPAIDPGSPYCKPHNDQHIPELNMIKFAVVAISLAALASSNAFAEGKTRAEVYQELVEAQQNGLDFVTDTSYPAVDPLFAPQVERMQQQRLAQQNAASSVAVTSPSPSATN
jgi:Domain of unknown function (DUF4148)